MTRNLKALGLALIAAFAMSAVVASAAQAEETTAHCETVGTYCVVTGHQINTQQFTAPAISETGVTCKKVTYEGTAHKTFKTIEVTPTYSECSAFGFATTDINHNECKYHLELTNKVDETVGGTKYGTITVTIKCPAGKSIEITPTLFGSSVCTVTVGEQMVGGELDVENSGTASEMDLALESTLEGIKYTVDTNGCKAGSAGLHEDGKLHGGVTVTAHEDVEPPYVEGARVGITID